MKKISVLLGAIILCAALAACGTERSQDVVSKALGIDASSGAAISTADTHGGFHGDGQTCIALKFDNHAGLDSIKNNSQWKAFPLDKTTQALVYGIEDKAGKTGPFLNDHAGNSLIPQIQNGYYLLIDRHTDTKTDILERNSFHFTIGLYDTDSDILYFCKLDT